MIKGVLFDLDGTLLDSAPDFVFCLNHLLQRFSIPDVDIKLIRGKISDGSSSLIELGFGAEVEKEKLSSLKEDLLKLYEDNLLRFGEVFKGVGSLIKYLEDQNISWGIVTNKPVKYARRIINECEELHSCQILICPEDISITKPAPEGILLACEKLSLDPKDVIYVGDHMNDIKAAEHAGAIAIGCTYGYALTNTNIPKRHLNARSINELEQHIKSLLK